MSDQQIPGIRLCGTCKHYQPEETYLEVQANPGRCLRIPDYNSAPNWWSSSSDELKAELVEWWKQNKGASYDYEGYSSGFYCAPDFGCVLHEAKGGRR